MADDRGAAPNRGSPETRHHVSLIDDSKEGKSKTTTGSQVWSKVSGDFDDPIDPPWKVSHWFS